MEKLRLVYIMTCVGLIGGCSSTKLNYQPEVVQISFPEIGVETKASLGDKLLEQGSRMLTDGIQIDVANNIRGYKFSPGFYPKIGEDSKYTFHSYQVGQSFTGMGVLLPSRDPLGLPLSMPESIRASKSKQELCLPLALGAKACDTETRYLATKRPVVTQNSFQQILIYNGRVGDQIKIAYREFSGDLARPAFSNEVQYDLSKSNEITYKGAKIRVVDAGNDGITYVVLSNFNTTQ